MACFLHIVLPRYITEKEFEHQNWFLFYPEEGNTRGAPSSLLRGVEFGIESKALLFKRMCAYAGLHAIVIKGYCKVFEICSLGKTRIENVQSFSTITDLVLSFASIQIFKIIPIKKKNQIMF
jgi:hypothetical protein